MLAPNKTAHSAMAKKTLIFSCFLIVLGSLLLTWGVYLVPASKPTVTVVLTSPLFWGLLLISGGICAVIRAYSVLNAPQWIMICKVSEVIDGDTFKISPEWKWTGQTGDTVRPLGYDAPEKGHPGYEPAKKKLENLILNKEVELRNPAKLSYQRLLCDVYFGGKNLASFFPEYQ